MRDQVLSQVEMGLVWGLGGEHEALCACVCVRVGPSGAATRQILTIRERIFTENITQHMFEHSPLTQCQHCQLRIVSLSTKIISPLSLVCLVY